MINKKEQGSVLIFSLLITGTIIIMTLTLVAIYIPKIRIAFESVGSSVAMMAADSATEWCLYVNRGKLPSVSQPTMSNGATYVLTPSDCTTQPLNFRAVGTYKGVSRSFKVQEQ